MGKRKPLWAMMCALMALNSVAAAELRVGDAAPSFAAVDTRGKVQRLSDYRGKIVVLEWSSPECLYSLRYYDNGTLGALYEFAAANDIVWINVVPKLTTISTAQLTARVGSPNKIVVVDSEFAVASAYGAATTPEIQIIDKRGVLAYSGAIDSTATLKKTTSAVVPYVRNALDDLLANRQVARKITQAFGCYIQNTAGRAPSTPVLSAIDSL